MGPCCCPGKIVNRIVANQSRSLAESSSTNRQIAAAAEEKRPADEAPPDASNPEPAPPPYTEGQNQPVSQPAPPSYPDEKAPLQPSPSPESSAGTSYPPKSHHMPAATRTLHIYYKKALSSQVTITDSDKTTTLYDCECRCMRKPQVIVRSSAFSTQVGTGSFHLSTMSLDCDLGFPPKPCSLKPRGLLKSGYTFPSPRSKGGDDAPRWTWRNDSFWGLNIVCEDENGVAVARLDSENWSWKKCGRLELTAAVDGSDDEKRRMMEAIIVTGLSIIEYKHQRNQGSGGAGIATS